MSDKLDNYTERLAALQERGELSQEASSLMKEMLEELTELNRSNKALRRAILKNGQGSAMSTRLRDALYE